MYSLSGNINMNEWLCAMVLEVVNYLIHYEPVAWNISWLCY
jgi:hypothetical protein